MDIQEIKQTDVWTLYDEQVNFARLRGMYNDTDVNYRMYNGDQWHGLKVKGVEKIQYNFIKPIVKYKVGNIMSNLFAINYSSENFENKDFRQNAEKICQLLNKKAANIWEKDYMDLKLRLVVKDAAINDEGVIYSVLDEKTHLPTNEILNKVDVYYGNENDSDIQSQPYILVKQRKPVSEVQEMALLSGVPKNEILHIIGDMDNIEEAGESAKYEKDNMCTVVTKYYKHGGTVHFSRATKFVELKKDTDTGLTYYPIAHLIWEEKKGCSRGEGEVRHLIPNQIETNKTAMRRAIAVKNTAYPQKVVNMDMVSNPSDIDKVGSTIKVKGGMAVSANVHPAQMSSDAHSLLNELISSTRELAGAGDIATGNVNPENASGRAILAIQQASEQPLTEHLEYVKSFIEDIARIWLDIITVYNKTITLEDEVTNPVTGEKQTVLKEVLQDSLKQLQASVKVNITPKGAFDKYAQEQSLENLLVAGMFQTGRMPELKLYIKTLDDDSVMPKEKLEKLVALFDEEQQKISNIEAKAQMMRVRGESFLNSTPHDQAVAVSDANNLLSQLGNGGIV